MRAWYDGLKRRCGAEATTSFIFALALVGLAAGYAALIARLPVPNTGDNLGPRVFPMLITAAMLGCAAALGLEGWASMTRYRETRQPAQDDAIPAYGVSLLAALAMAVYFITFERLGYILSTALFLWAAFTVFNRGRPRTNALTAVLFAVGTYGVFGLLLEVQLPSGILPF